MMKQRFTDKHPILGLLLWTYGAFVISEMLFGVIATFAIGENGLEPGTATGIGGSVGSILVLVFWYLHNRKEYHFMPRKGDIGGSLKLIFLPMLVYWILLFGAYAYFAKGFPFAPIGLKQIMMASMAGLVEEVCFREIAVSYMAGHWMSEKRIPLIAALSGFLFGLTHMTNAIGGWEITSALLQTLLCIFMGVFYASIYLRKGNVWVLCLFHFVHDILTFMAAESVTVLGVTELPDWITIYIAAIEFALCLCGFFYIRRAKRQEIINLWEYKWSGASS